MFRRRSLTVTVRFIVLWVCAVCVSGCVAQEDRIENKPDAGAAADHPGVAPPGPTPIRPPTSAIAEPEPNPVDTAPPTTAPDPPGEFPASTDTPGTEPDTGPDSGPDEPMVAAETGADSEAPPAVEPTPEVEVEPAPGAPDPPAEDPDEPEDAPAPDPAPPDEPPLHAAWAEGSAYNALFKPDELVTVTGDIEAVGTFVPAEGAQPGLLLNLVSGEDPVAVHGAPLRYLRSIEVRFDFGERLSIEGAWATIDGERVLLAQAITRGETRVELRDAETGRPAWVPVPANARPDGEDGVPPSAG